eukprot:COSAG01_NODE_2802_length_7049_cov_2.441871_6_plen_98_part_00
MVFHKSESPPLELLAWPGGRYWGQARSASEELQQCIRVPPTALVRSPRGTWPCSLSKRCLPCNQHAALKYEKLLLAGSPPTLLELATLHGCITVTSR